MTRQHSARRDRVAYDIRASPASECHKYDAAHIFIVRANHLSRDELSNRKIPAMSYLRH